MSSEFFFIRVDLALTKFVQSTLRFLWNHWNNKKRTKSGAAKFFATNGVDYYPILFAFELLSFLMYVLV
jgi:hypothetical protein